MFQGTGGLTGPPPRGIAKGSEPEDTDMQTIETQGVAMPRLGLGTFRLTGAAGQAAVESALAMGYRHIDTAEAYGNEEQVGAGIAAAGVARRELHVTTKVWHDHLEPAAIRGALDDSLGRLRLDCVDLYLVHWPAPGMDLPAILETLQQLKQEGRVRAIGVANFTLPLLRQAIEEFGAPIACNQVEYHVYLDQSAVLGYLRSRGVPLVAYCPLAQGRAAEDSVLAGIAAKHGATPGQVALKWLLDQDGVAAIPKSQRPEGQRANLEAWTVALDDDDRRAIAGLPKDRRLVSPAFAPRWDPLAR